MHYLYHHDYLSATQAPAKPLENESSNLILHVKLYGLGEFYLIEGLKALALKKFRADAQRHWQTDDFLKAAEEAYTSTPSHDRDMRNEVLKAICDHPVLLDNEEAQNVVRAPDLCFDLMMRFRTIAHPRLRYY